MAKSTCTIENCNRLIRCVGLCELHYERQRRGVPLTPPHRDEATMEYRLLLKRLIVESGCWEWQGYRNPGGYGEITFQGVGRSVHRAAYETWIGPIPDGMWVLHHCDNPPCFNPEHLYAGTCQDNHDDMKQRSRHHNTNKTNCPNGHPYDFVDSRGGRGCRECQYALKRA